MNFFECVVGSGGGSFNTLIVTCDGQFAGKTITCTDGTKTFTQTCPSTAPYIVTFDKLYAETWTVSGEIGGTTFSETIEISDTFTLQILIGFDWRAWVDTARFLDSTDYNSLDEVLADEEAVRELCLEHACVDYLAGISIANNDVETIINNDLFAKWTNNSDYALDKYATVSDLVSLMNRSHKELKAMVPTMTSDTTPSGTVIGSGIYSINYKYYAFDGNDNTQFMSNYDLNPKWCGYTFTSPMCAKKAYVKIGENLSDVTAFKIQGSNDGGNTVTDLKTVTVTSNVYEYDVDLDNDNTYSSYIISQVNYSDVGRSFCIKTLQFYTYEYSTKYNLGEWVLKPQVPTMTSNTTPSGVVNASSTYSSSYPAWKAFDNNLDVSSSWISNGQTNQWISYKFVEPVRINGVSIYICGTGDRPLKNFRVEASNDDSNYKPLYTGVFENKEGAQYFTFDNDTAYLYYRLYILDRYATGLNLQLTELQFYAYEPKGNVPVMTSNTAPYGAVSASTVLSGSAAYLAFDGQNSTCWNASSDSYPQHIQYKSVNPICVKRFHMKIREDNIRVQTYKIQASNDGFVNDIHDLTDTLTATYGADGDWVDINNSDYYLYHRVLCLTGTYTVMLEEVQFYGRELSVSVPTMTGNTTPYGEASADSGTSSSYPAWKAFDGDGSSVWTSGGSSDNSKYVEYDFITPLIAKKAILTVGLGTSSTLLQSLKYHVEVFDLDANDWVAISEVTEKNTNTVSTYYIDIADKNINKIKYVVDQNLKVGSGYGSGDVYTLQVYGLDYSEKEFEEGTTKKWLYDHGLELESIENTALGGTLVKGTDSMVLTTPTSGIGRISTSNAIDITSYSLERMKLGKIATLYSDTYTCSLGLSGTRDTVSLKGFANSLKALLPNNVGLDISSVNESAYPWIYTSNFAVTCEITELWLE